MSGDVTALWIVSGIGLAGEAGGILVHLLSRPKSAQVTSELTDQDKARRRSARLINERLKLFAAFLSGIGIAFLITVAVAPVVQHSDVPIAWSRSLMALAVAVVLQAFGQWRSRGGRARIKLCPC